ncbi:MAG: DUF370 domain-containing protein [Candidatus Ozemobacteraceae bacterium]
MKTKLLNIGFGNVVVASRVIAIVSPGSAPIKRLKEDARDAGKLIDATYGRKTRAIIVTDSDHVVLSAINPDTAALRLMGKKVDPDDTDPDTDTNPDPATSTDQTTEDTNA